MPRPYVSDGDLPALEAATCFVLSPSSRILRQQVPDNGTGPRLYVAGGSAGNTLLLRHDVGEEAARTIQRLAEDEPPLSAPESIPVHLDDYVRVLAAEAPLERCEPGLAWTFPDQLNYGSTAATRVASDTPQGDRLLARLRATGMPAELAALGFVDVGEFWSPWCAALERAEIASLAFSARLTDSGAETGVATVPRFRGRGFAAAATAGWAALPALSGRTLFYSTSRTNVSSQRVAARLGLRFIGATLSIR